MLRKKSRKTLAPAPPLTPEMCEKYITAAAYKLKAALDLVHMGLEYKKDIFDEQAAMFQFFPFLDSQHCPECKYDFGKPLSRGRQCPRCNAKLRVSHYRLIGPSYEKKYKQVYNDWSRYFEAKLEYEMLEHRLKWGDDPMDALVSIATAYEKLEDFHHAWHTFSGIELPTPEIWLTWVSRKQASGECTGDDMLFLDFWRAEFLDRCFESEKWNVNVDRVVEAYGSVIEHAKQYGVRPDCHAVLQSVTRLSVLSRYTG